MKKSLLLGLAVATGLGMMAQHGRQNLGGPKLIKMKNITKEANSNAVVANRPLVNTNKTQVPPYNQIGSSANAFTLLVEDQNCLSYNADINTVAFVHRKNTTWTGFTNANSGSIQVTYTNDNNKMNGAAPGAWDTTIVFADGTNLGRYPGGAFYNPMGNTTQGNARVVVSGPAVIGGGFGGNYFASGPLSNGVVTTSDQDVTTYFGNTNASLDSLGFCRINQLVANGRAFMTGEIAADPTATQYSALQYKGAGLMRGTYNTGASGFDWDMVKCEPAFMPNVAGGYPYAINVQRTAFGPSGMVGYCMMTGVLASATGSAMGYQPIVYKTTDGGNTWNLVNANYQWANNTSTAGDAEVTNLLNCLIAGTNASSPYQGVVPFFSDNNGTDLIVDNNNNLHIITTVQGAYSTHPDSLGYTYNSEITYGLNNPKIIDFVTSGNGSYDAIYIDSIMTEPTDETIVENPWSQGGNGVGQTNRIQASRTPDGTRIFVTWADSDPSATGNNYNGAPDIYIVGINPATRQVSAKVQATYGIQEVYFHFTSDITKVVSPGNYLVPMSYSKNATFDPNVKTDHYYIHDGIMADGAINQAPGFNAPSYCSTIGIANNNDVEVSIGQNFPNPFNKTSVINVTLKHVLDINVTVYNTVGQMVISKSVKGEVGNNEITLDAANLTSGLYFYTVKAGEVKETKKMMISK